MSHILDKFSLGGKTVVVTGGGGLLGRQFTLALAQAGARVVVADIDDDTAQTQAALIIAQGLVAKASHLDVTDSASIHALVETCLADFGTLDVLVNNAALDPKFEPQYMQAPVDNAFETYPIQAWQDSLKVNLTGLFLMSQATVVPMLAQKSGVIINICSTYGLVGPDQRLYDLPGKPRKFKPVDYAVTKAGVLGFTHYLAAYYAGKNIRVNALSPGGVFNAHDDDFVKNYAAHTILGRMADIDEMNAAILFLASDASSYMTGANLIVDGGWTAW